MILLDNIYKNISEYNNMGCDYYVYTYLEIKHKYGFAYIELNKKKGWFCDCIEPDKDSDDEDENFNHKLGQHIEIFLKPGFDPILIYDGENFLKEQFIMKYFNIIHEKIEKKITYWRDSGKINTVKDIQQIRKIEIREEC
jgi:hypothetical protein